MQSHYLFADKFGRPARGNDKGKVEGIVGYARRNFMVPVPRFASSEAFNAHLEAACRRQRERRLRGHAETIGERFERDRAALLPLPAAPDEACEKVAAGYALRTDSPGHVDSHELDAGLHEVRDEGDIAGETIQLGDHQGSAALPVEFEGGSQGRPIIALAVFDL